MGCSASSLLPIHKAISPTEPPAEAEKKPANSVNGNADNAAQSNGVTKLPPPSIPEEVVKEEKNENSDSSPVTVTKSEKPDEEVITKNDKPESSTTEVETSEQKPVEETKQAEKEESKESEPSNGSNSAKEVAANDIEPVKTITIVEVTKPSSPPPQEHTTQISDTSEEKEKVEQESKAPEPEPEIPIISDEPVPVDTAISQSLKLPDEELIEVLSPKPPALEPLAPLPQLKPLPILEPISLPSLTKLDEFPSAASEVIEETKQVAGLVADRIIAEIVPKIDTKTEAIKEGNEGNFANVFETKVKLVEQKMTQNIEDLKQMPEKIINETIEKLSMELNSVTNDVLSAMDAVKENVECQLESITSKSEDTKKAVKSESETIQEIIESIPVALNNVAENIVPSLTDKLDESSSCLALQLDSLGFDFEEPENGLPAQTTDEVALVDDNNSYANAAPQQTNSSPLASSLPPSGFGIVAGELTDTNDGNINENAEGNDSNGKSKPGGNKKNRNKNRRNKNKSGSGRASPPPTPETPLDASEVLPGPQLLSFTKDETLDSIEPPETLIKIDEEDTSDSTTGSQLTVKSVNMNPSNDGEELLSDTPTNIVSLE